MIHLLAKTPIVFSLLHIIIRSNAVYSQDIITKL